MVSFQLVGQGQLANRQKVGRRQPQRLVELSDRLIEEGHGLLALALLEQRLRLLCQRDADAVVDAEMDPLELGPARDRLGLQLLRDRRARRLGAVAALQLGVAAGPRRALAQEEHPLQILLQRLFVFRLLVVGVAGDERLLQGRHDAARPLHVHPDDQERRRDAGDRSFPSREEGAGPRRHVARARREPHQERAQATQQAAQRQQALRGEQRQDRHHRRAEAREIEEQQHRPHIAEQQDVQRHEPAPHPPRQDDAQQPERGDRAERRVQVDTHGRRGPRRGEHERSPSRRGERRVEGIEQR